MLWRPLWHCVVHLSCRGTRSTSDLLLRAQNSSNAGDTTKRLASESASQEEEIRKAVQKNKQKVCHRHAQRLYISRPDEDHRRPSLTSIAPACTGARHNLGVCDDSQVPEGLRIHAAGVDAIGGKSMTVARQSRPVGAV